MKKLYILSFLLLNFLVNAQIINFPDPVFKAKLKSWGVVKNINGSSFVLDSNGDGEIEVSEALNVYEINTTISNSNIFTNTSGIEYFTNIRKLNISNNNIGSLDVSSLINLKELICNSCSLTNLNVQGLINLEILSCGYNQLGNIDLNGLISLQSFSCTINSILNLTIQNLPNLQEIYCGAMGYNVIDSYNVVTLSNLPNLTYLNCATGSLSRGINELNMYGLDNLIEINCRLNALTTIDISMLPNIQLLDVINSYNLESIFAKNGANETISIGSNQSTNNLKYICVDEFQLIAVQNSIASYMTSCNVNSYCSFVPGGNYYIFKGENKIDVNGNGCLDSTLSIPLLKFAINDGNVTEYFIANSDGNFSIPLLEGNYTITPVNENPSNYIFQPPNAVMNFPSQVSPLVQDFCISIIPHSDVEIMIVPINPARPGFDANYKIVFRNKGNQVENGSVSLTFDDAVLDYVSSNPVYDSSVTNSFIWNYTNLQPFETREIGITFNVNSPTETPAVNNGDVLNYTATIATANTDETIEDNSFTLNQTVVGSYDPNDKTCLEGEVVEPSMIGKYVHYVIRFENTGTYPAQNIVVKDMIDTSKFDLTSLVPLHSSHDFFTRIKDNKVEFIFENINLDFNDATNDGYVAFKIKTLPTLSIGDTFSNEANIYFDYNFPITTNNYVTTIQALSNPSSEFEKEFVLYPNPVKDILNISGKNQAEIKSVEIYNIIGQLVIVVPNAVQNIDVSSLESGTYFVKVNSEKGSGNTKFIKE